MKFTLFAAVLLAVSTSIVSAAPVPVAEPVVADVSTEVAREAKPDPLCFRWMCT